MKNYKLTESLCYGDLKNFVSEVFTVDRYSSKMGEDSDIVVLGFTVKEKAPALDLMEFIEKGYKFVLDADISAGEEYNGQYQVFVEMERTKELPQNLTQLMKGISNLCDCTDWKFKYQKSSKIVELTQENIIENIPTTKEEYDAIVLREKNKDVQDFFNQGAVNVTVESNNTITFKKPYASDISAKFIAIGNYDAVKETVPGKLSIDETSHGQIMFLTKYLGNYDIDKIGNKFLIKNGNNALVIEKTRW